MKRIKLLFILVLFLIAMPYVKASTASTRLSGTNTIKVGNTTTIYVSINSSGSIKGVDLTYDVSGNVSVISATATGGMTEQSRNGNRVLLYAPTAVSSGSSVFAITVKGTAVGTGTITINRLEATVDGETAVGNSASYTITVNPAKTQAEIDAENARAQAQREAAEKARQEAEARAKAEEEARKLALSKAELLVEASERSVLKDDYDAALDAVNALDDSESKTKLLERLDKVKFDIAVKEACNNCKVTPQEKPSSDTSDGDVLKWIILNMMLLLLAIGEFIYIVISRRKENQ